MISLLSSLISKSRTEEGPLVVGVTGMDTSGKSVMTTLLAEELLRSGLAVQIIRLDDFHHPLLGFGDLLAGKRGNSD